MKYINHPDIKLDGNVMKLEDLFKLKKIFF
jgi:hypothetical protein